LRCFITLAVYSYRAVNGTGERSAGNLTSATRREAVERLLAHGWHVLELKEDRGRSGRPLAPGFLRRRGLRLPELTRQLATLCGSGVPLVQSMTVLIDQTEQPHARRVLSDVLESVKAGSSLSDALEQHRDVFPEIMVSMVRVGEASGALDEVLARLAEMFEKQDELRGEVRAALAYPALVLCLGVASAAVLVGFVIPRLSVMFEGLGERMPLPTRILCGISDLVAAYWWLIGIGLVGLVAGVRAAMVRPSVRLTWDGFKLRIPWAGRLIRQAAVARFARSLGTLVKAEVHIVEALQVVHAAAGNAVIAAAIRDMAREVQEGVSLAELMKSADVFPPLVVQMVAVGEETGRLDQMLLRAAEAYDRQAAASTKLMTSLLAPALILCVAVIVAFIIVSLVLPIFQISAGIR